MARMNLFPDEAAGFFDFPFTMADWSYDLPREFRRPSLRKALDEDVYFAYLEFTDPFLMWY